MWKQLELSYIVSGMVESYDHLGKLVQCLAKKCLLYVPAFPVSVYTQTEINACVHTDIRIIIVKVVPNWKQTIMFIYVRTNKQTAVYPYSTEIKENQLLIHITTWANFKITVLTQRNQTQKRTFLMIPFI